MKNGKRFCLLLLLCAAVLTLLCAAAAAESTEDGFQITDGVLTKYTGPGGDVTIPDGVTEIGSNAFENCEALTGIVIPDSVTKIGKVAFSFCTGLKEVTVPDGVTSIEDHVFYHCEALERVSLPKGIVSIGHSSFEYCLKLTDIQLPSGLKSIDHSAFWACRSLVKLTLPRSLETIGNTSFGKCSAMNPLQVPETLKSIGEIGPEAPRFCCETGTDAAYVISKASTYNYFCEDGLMLRYTFDSKGEPDGGLVLNDYVGAKKEVLIPSDVTSINNEDIFKDRTDLVAIRFQGNTRVSTSYFTGCTAVIQCPAGYSNAVYLLQQQASSQLNIATYTGSTLMCYAGSLTELKLQNDWIYEIAADAFNGSSSDADSLETIILPAYLQQLLDGTFSGLDNLKEIYFGDELNQIGEKCFGERTAGELPKLYCTAGTKTARTLSNAGYTFLTPHVHTIVTQPAVEATYTEPGKTEGSYCSECGEVFTAQEDVPALGEKDFTFTTDDTGATVTGYTGENADVQLPSVLGGKPVVAIGDNAFNGNETITSITMPDSVTTIGQRAFYDCNALKQLTLPENLTDIGAYAFSGCTALQNVTLPEKLATIAERAFDYTGLTAIHIPASVTMIGQRALSQNYDLLKITVDEANNVYCAEDNVLYNKEKTKLIRAGSGLSGDWSIPFGVKTVEGMAFWNCWTLETLRIPATVQSIDQISMLGGCCEKLSAIVVDAANPVYASLDGALCSKDGTVLYYLPENIGTYTVPDSVTRIANGALQFTTSGQEGLNLTLPESLSVIEDGNFSFIHGVFTFLNPNLKIGSDWFMDCNAEKVVIRGYAGSTAQALAEEKNFAFEDLTINAQFQYTVDDTGVTVTGYTGQGGAVEIPSMLGGKLVVAIGDNAFNGNETITSVTMPDSVTYIGDMAFDSCGNLRTVKLSAGLEYLGDYAFWICESLEQIDLPSGLKSIGTRAFERNRTLTSIQIPASVTSIGEGAFAGCSSLKDFRNDSGVTILQENGILYNENGTLLIGRMADMPADVVLRDGLLSIPTNFFVEEAITSVVIPNSVTEMGFSVFQNCHQLTKVQLSEGLTTLASGMFYDCPQLAELYVPNAVTFIDPNAIPDTTLIRSSATAYARTWAQENGMKWEHDVHTVVTQPAVEATYTEPGKTEGSYCSECGEVLTAQEDVPALGEKDFTFTTDDTGATVTGYKGESTEVHIPSVLGGKPVTKIAEKAFYSDLRITGMHIPASVAEIEEFSFYQCRALDTITVNAESPYYTVEENVLYTKDMTTLVRAGNVLEDGDLHVPSTVTYIAAGAFSDNKTLQELWIPASVQFINGTNSCGSFCRNFRRFHIDEGNTQYASPDGALYNRTVTQLFLVPEAIGTYRVPDSVTSIADCAIGGTYYGSTTTLDVTMPEGLTFTGDCMFQWMQGTVTFLNPKIRFGEKCFMSSQDSVIIRGYAGSTAQTYAKTNGIQFEDIEAGLAFQYTTDDTGATVTGYTGQGGTVEIPSMLGGKPVVAIGDNAFNRNETITSITMPDSVMTIGQRAFYDCNALKQLTLPENLTDIGAYAFSGCLDLQNVTLPGKLATIAERAFDYTGLTAIHIPASVTMIGQQALSQNYDLLKITVDEANTVYCAEDNVLYNKEKTTLIRAGSGLSGDWSIPFGVKTVEGMAFWNCWTLETLRIPATVQSIDQISMLGGCCEKLSAIVVDAANPVYASLDGALCSKDGTVLYYLPENIGTYTVPDSVTRIANGALQFTTSGQEGLNLTLPESLSVIEDGNFSFIHGVFTFLNPNLKIGSDWFMDCNAEKVVIRGYAGSTAQVLAEEKNFAFEDLTISAQFQYTVDDTGATVTSYTGQGGTVEIPSMLGGKPVVAIGNNAFQMPNLEIRTDITAVILPEGLQSIGRAAFWGCAGITSIEIPDSVTEIGVAAFETCTALAQVTLPQNLTQISDNLFHNCPLTEIDLPQGITRIGDYAFRDTGLTAIVIPEGTLSIGKCAFEGCSELSAVTIPVSVTEIGESAFANCPKLAPLDEILPEKLTKIIDGVVYNADGTQIIGILPTLSGEVRIADGITVIPQRLFANNTSITSVILPESVKTIEWGAFSGCTSLAQIEFPEGLLTIGDYAFSYTGLTTVVLPSTLTTFGEGVFDGCTKLANIEDKSGKFLKVVDGIVYNVDGTQILSVLESCTGEVRIAEGVTEIPAWLFNGNSQITSIVIPEGVTKIGNNAFSYCENLTSVTLPSTLTTLGEDVFNGCIKLANLEDKSGKFLKVVDGIVYNVDGTQILSVLEGCTGEVRIAEGVTEISEDLFRGRNGITSIYLPDSVTAIDDWAFAYCENLKMVRLPAGLERLEDYTFWFCESLEQISLPASLKSIGGCAFLGNALKEIELPEGLNVIGRRAFERNPLTFIRIPASVTQIEEGAFAGCSALKNLQNDSSVVLLQENGVLYNEDGTVLIGRMADMPAEVVLKEGLLSIPTNFFMAENITSIVIPDSVTSAGYSVFWGCRQLTEVRLSECLTVLESGMFDECTQLGELYVPSAVTSIDPTAIPDTTVIRSEPDAYARTWAQENGYVWQCAQHGETVIVEPAVPATRKHTGMTAKIQCSVCGAVISEPEEVPVFDGKVMKLPTALKSVQRETFLNLPAECFVLPDGCLVIGERAFADCKELKLVEIPSSVIAIAEDAFEGCGEGVVIVTPKGSAAERFALAHDITVTSDEP